MPSHLKGRPLKKAVRRVHVYLLGRLRAEMCAGASIDSTGRASLIQRLVEWWHHLVRRFPLQPM